ncbi:MAG TPA: 1,4-beta-xylanase [Cytophagales bacterium]|jgi:hypothetical protein|nr:1,4-beta-xylanase [Cytophagales bacterium]
MKRIFFLLLISGSLQAQQVWSVQQANEWYSKQPWLVGCNYIPHNAINELEMWQAETWDPATIDKELSWAESIGMNTLRVFLHDLLWQQDAEGFKKRLSEFLAICEKHHIKPMLVIFDSVWDPNPKLGKQHEPTPGVHNSGWVQSPGAAALTDEKQYPRLEAYVKGVVGAFANDSRVLCWDVWNEVDNVNTDNYAEPKNKLEIVQKLLPMVFAWARAAKPSQPLTCGVWQINYNDFKGFTPIEKIQLDLSDIISFHNYNDATNFEKSVKLLSSHYQRPLICTEYLARGNKSTFETILPVGKKYNVAMYNWGFVKGKTQTNLPWDSWRKPYVNGREPAVWHHEIFYPDGKPYQQQEVDVIRSLTKQLGK